MKIKNKKMKRNILNEEVNRMRTLMGVNIQFNKFKLINEVNLSNMVVKPPSLLKYLFDDLGDNLRRGLQEFEFQGIRKIRFGMQQISKVEWDDITRKLLRTDYPDGFDIWTTLSQLQKRFLINLLKEKGTDMKIYDDWIKECTESLSKRVGQHVTESEFLDLVNDHLITNMIPNNPNATYLDALNDLFPGNTFHFDITQDIVQGRYVMSKTNVDNFVDKVPFKPVRPGEEMIRQTAKDLKDFSPTDFAMPNFFDNLFYNNTWGLAKGLRATTRRLFESIATSAGWVKAQDEMNSIFKDFISISDGIQSGLKSFDDLKAFQTRMMEGIQNLSNHYSLDKKSFIDSFIESVKTEMRGKFTDETIEKVAKKMREEDPFGKINLPESSQTGWWKYLNETSTNYGLHEWWELISRPFRWRKKVLEDAMENSKLSPIRIHTMNLSTARLFRNQMQRTVSFCLLGTPKTFKEFQFYFKDGWKGWGKLAGWMWVAHHVGVPAQITGIKFMINSFLLLATTIGFKTTEPFESWAEELFKEFDDAFSYGLEGEIGYWGDKVLGFFKIWETHYDSFYQVFLKWQSGGYQKDIKGMFEDFLMLASAQIDELEIKIKEQVKKTTEEVVEKVDDAVEKVEENLKLPEEKKDTTVTIVTDSTSKEEAEKKMEQMQETYNKKSSKSEAQKFLGSKFACYSFGWAWDNTGLCYALNTETGEWERRSDQDNKQSTYPCE